MDRKLKVIIVLICIALGIAVLFLAVSMPGQRKEQNVETADVTELKLVYAYQNAQWNSAIEKTVEQFEQEHPDIRIEYQIHYEDTVYENIINKLIARDELGDIVQLKTPQPYAKSGLLGHISRDVVKEVQSDSVYVENGRIYGIGMIKSTSGIIYNKELFREVGISEPKTYDEFLKCCRRLAAHQITPIGVGGSDLWHMEFWVNHFFRTDILSRNRSWQNACRAGETSVLLGMLPLMAIGLILSARYSGNLSRVMTSNYSQITGYFCRNVTDMIRSVDQVMGELYDYQTEEGSLNEVIKDDTMSDSEKNLYMMTMLRSLISKSGYISSERFVDQNGRVYSLFYDQNKTMRNNSGFYNKVMRPEGDVSPRSLMIMRTVEESQYCVNTDDYIFTLIRNFMDISSVEKIDTEILGTFYVDINVEQIDQLVKNVNVENGKFYVYQKDSHAYIYSPDIDDYLNGADPLVQYGQFMTAEKGNCRVNAQWIFYERIGDTDVYAVLLLNEKDVMSGLSRNRAFLVLLLCFAAFVLLGLYMFFSRRMSQPVSELKMAMEEVQKGNLSVRADVKTKDEMKYISEGFNKMVQDLQTYIDKVYVAQICQKEAELNALKMQIQPHYLYNTLDVIRMTALDHDDEETAELLESLAYQLRYVLGEQNERTAIREEIKMLREYFVIMKARYQGRISMTVSISDEDASLLVPKMLFQPIIENAVRHGLRQKKGRGTVAIQAARQNGELVVSIMDDGIGMDEERVKRMQEVLDTEQVGYVGKEGWVSVGMKNVYDRIKLNCGKQYGFVIQSVEGMGTIVTFHLPVWEEDAEDVENNRGR